MLFRSEVIDEDGELNFRTKGDSNKSADGGLVNFRNVIGRPVFSIPYLGYLAYYLQRPPGIYLFITLVGLTLLLSFLQSLIEE